MTASRKLLPLTVLAVLMLGLMSSSALAQQFGVRAGVSGNPDQFYIGAHVDAGPVAEKLRFKPNLEVGIGSDTTVTAINLEFVYPVQLNNSREWSLYPGIGPAFNIYNFNNNTDLRGGLNILLGLAHEDGFFAELKVGAIDSPDIKFGVGYTFRP